MAMFEKQIVSKVVLDDTVPLTCIIEAAHKVKDHTEYQIKVQRGPVPEHSWVVNKRYNDFVTLDTALRLSGIELPLPPKKVFGNKEREFVAERQLGLQQYLAEMLSHPVLAQSLLVKKFLDPDNYPATLNLQEVALQHISMFFRSEPQWEVVEPLPDIGWRLRKQCFLVKNKTHPKLKYILSWCKFGPDKFLQDKDLEVLMKLLPTFNHPYICPVLFAISSESSGICIRPFHEKGTLKDLLCKSRPKGYYMKKYGHPKMVTALPVPEVRRYGKQILETLKYLHDKGFAYGHIHTGNVLVEDEKCRLLDLENPLLGLPSRYRPFFTQFKKIQAIEAVEVYSFGHLLYEMTLGVPLNTATLEGDLPPTCPPEIRSVLESILTPEACRNGMPTLADLLTHPLFSETFLAGTERPTIKIPSKLKEALREARGAMEKRLKEEQKVINQFKRLSKATAYHMSEDEKKKRRKSRKKAAEQSMMNGGGDAAEEAPTSPTSPTTPTTPSGAGAARKSKMSFGGIGEYPPGYNAKVHGPYNPAVYYGPADKQLKQVKLGELGEWLGRRSKNPLDWGRSIARVYWRWNQKWLLARKPSLAPFAQAAMILSSVFYVLSYPTYTKYHRIYKYHA